MAQEPFWSPILEPQTSQIPKNEPKRWPLGVHKAASDSPICSNGCGSVYHVVRKPCPVVRKLYLVVRKLRPVVKKLALVVKKLQF